MKNNIIADFEKKKFTENNKIPKFRTGDTVQVSYNIQEGDKKKVHTQKFEGVVIGYKRGTIDASFTVRKIGANAIGVERVFPLYSPNIVDVQVISPGKVRRSKLFYLRERSGKSARIRSRFD
ncbi:MAG: 50S ribosomal protein L19 [Oligoflexales bacterium]|nr:50S ribosomal protein L19 [Oligoflexales bacterium]